MAPVKSSSTILACGVVLILVGCGVLAHQVWMRPSRSESPVMLGGIQYKGEVSAGLCSKASTAEDIAVSRWRVQAVHRVISSPIAPVYIGSSLCETLDDHYNFLDAWNALSDEEKAVYDTQPPARNASAMIQDLVPDLQGTNDQTLAVVTSILGAVRATRAFYKCDADLNQKLADVQAIIGKGFRYWMKGMTMSPSDLEAVKKMDTERAAAQGYLLNFKRKQAEAYLTDVFCPAVYEVFLDTSKQFLIPTNCERTDLMARMQTLQAPLTGDCWSYYQCGKSNCESDKQIWMDVNGTKYPVVLGRNDTTKVLLEHGFYYHPVKSYRRASDALMEMKRKAIVDRSVLSEMLDLVDDVQLIASNHTATTEEESILFSVLAFSQGYSSFRARRVVNAVYWQGSFQEGGACRIAAGFTALANVHVLTPYHWMPVDKDAVDDPTKFNGTLQWTLSVLQTPTAISSIYNQRNSANPSKAAYEARKVSEEGVELILKNATKKVRQQLKLANGSDVSKICFSILGIRHLLRQTHNMCNRDLLLQGWNKFKKGVRKTWKHFKMFFFPRKSARYSYMNETLNEEKKFALKKKLAQQQIFEKALQSDRYGNEVLCPILFETLKAELRKEVIDADKIKTITLFLRNQVPSMASPASCMYFYWCGNATCPQPPGLQPYNAWTEFENSIGDWLWNSAESLQKSTDRQMNITYDPEDEKVPLVERWEKRARKWKYHRKNTDEWLNPDRFIVKEGCNATEAKEKLHYECFLPIVLGNKEMTLMLIKHDAYLDPRISKFSDDFYRFATTKAKLRQWHVETIDVMLPLNLLAMAHLSWLISIGDVTWGVPLTVIGALHIAETVSMEHHNMEELFGDNGMCTIVSLRLMDAMTEHHALERLNETQLATTAYIAELSSPEEIETQASDKPIMKHSHT